MCNFETALSDNGFSGDWMSTVIELAVENIIPPFVEIRGQFNIEVWGSEGVYAIRDALLPQKQLLKAKKMQH